MQRVLIAAPVYVEKEYAMNRWIENVQGFKYENKDVLLIDNSPSDAFAYRYADRVRIVRMKGDRHLKMLNVTKSMEIIRQHFLKGPYDIWFNLEIDVIPQDDHCIQKMLEYMKEGIDIVNHCYPSRLIDGDDHQGVGCSLIGKEIAKAINYNQAGDVSPDGWLWGKVRKHTQFKMIDLWGIFPIKHLAY